MPKFEYVAMDPKGKEVTGTLEAENQAAAHGRIREMGYFPTSIGEAGKDKRSGKSPADAKMTARTSTRKSLATRSFGGNTVKSKVLTAFTRQLATLIDAGLPILRGMDVLRKGEKDPTLRRIISKIAETVEGGSTFSEALAQHPKVFNRLFVNMVRAGEAGGVLDVTLARLADFQEKAQKIKNKVMAAMVYPSVVIFVAMSIMTFLMIVIVPKFQEIFRDLLQGAPLPALTQFVIDVSNLIQHQALLVVGVVVGLVIGVKIFGKTKKGRYVLDNVKLHMPVFGPLLQKVGIARFTRTLGTLIASGVPILQALNIVREASENAVIADAVSRVHDAVKEGERIVQPMQATKVFPAMVAGMVDVGEETGALPDVLMKIADVYDDEVDNAVAALTSMLEPIMIVFLAVIVGTIVIAMFMPLIGVINTLGAQ